MKLIYASSSVPGRGHKIIIKLNRPPETGVLLSQLAKNDDLLPAYSGTEKLIRALFPDLNM